MEPQRLDLSPLDPAGDQLGYERLVRRILDAAAPELHRRAASTTPLAAVAGWARPALAAAAIIAAMAAGAMFSMTRRAVEPASTMIEAMGVPAPAADWLAEGRAPTRGDLVVAMERRP